MTVSQPRVDNDRPGPASVPTLGLGRFPPAPRQADKLVERRMSLEQFGAAAFDDPGQKGLGVRLAQSAGYRDAVDDVAQGRQADN